MKKRKLIFKENNPIFLFFIKKTLFNLFITFAVFKTLYIALFVEFVDITSTQIAIILRIVLMLIAISLIFNSGLKKLHKAFIYILLIFIISFIVILYQFLFIELNYNYPINFLYISGITTSIIIFVVVLFLNVRLLSNLDKSFFYILLIAAIISIFVADYQSFNASTNTFVSTGRLQLRSLNPISYGYYGGLLVLLSFWRLLIFKENRLILLIGFLIGSWILIEANSRSPIIGTFLALFLSVYLIEKKKILILTFISVIFFLIYSSLFDLNLNQLNNRIFVTNDGGISVRFQIYKEYFEAISNNFIFPYMDPMMNLLMAHNIFFAIYSTTGIFGFIIFLYIIYHTIKISIELIKNKNEYGWAGIIFFHTLIVSSFSGSLLDENFWIFLTLINVYHHKFIKNK